MRQLNTLILVHPQILFHNILCLAVQTAQDEGKKKNIFFKRREPWGTKVQGNPNSDYKA